MTESLPGQLRFPVAQEVKKVAEQSASGYRRNLENFAVSEVRVLAEGLVLVFSFALSIE